MTVANSILIRVPEWDIIPEGALLEAAHIFVEPLEEWIEAQGWPIIVDNQYRDGEFTYYFETGERAALFKLFWS